MPVGDAVIKCRVRRAVSDYIAHHRDDAVAELDFYRAMPTLRSVIKAAALARTGDGGKHPHQWRIPCNVLREFGRCLSSREQDLREAPSFDELHRVVREVGDRIHGIGVLAVYDTALRIGVKRDLLPTRVYLHRGTMSGAWALGIDRSCPVISVSELPEPFADLKPHEIEDCLCIFKGLLSGEKLLRPRGCRCSGRGCARRTRKTTRSHC